LGFFFLEHSLAVEEMGFALGQRIYSPPCPPPSYDFSTGGSPLEGREGIIIHQAIVDHLSAKHRACVYPPKSMTEKERATTRAT
jgi:hypothetical protein